MRLAINTTLFFAIFVTLFVAHVNSLRPEPSEQINTEQNGLQKHFDLMGELSKLRLRFDENDNGKTMIINHLKAERRLRVKR